MKVLITGAGTLGTALVKNLMGYECPPQITVVDYNEEAIWSLEEAVPDTGQLWPPKLVLADIRDKERMRLEMKGIGMVFHTAALKHVRYTNSNPMECIRTNVEGTMNLLTLALEADVPTFVNMSSDKACSPSNIYGDSKKMGERLTTWASSPTRHYFSVRSGNFLGSRGSVFDRWKKQRASGKIKLTSPHMNRFFIKPEEFAEWLIASPKYAMSGTVCTPFLKNLNMGVVAEVVAEKWGVEVEEVGPGYGEKMDEIINGEEATRTTQSQFGWMTHDYKVGGPIIGAINTSIVPTSGIEETRQYLEGIL
jgi:UDP-N-acetylglucosamine 4,6-dehydratase